MYEFYPTEYQSILVVISRLDLKIILYKKMDCEMASKFLVQ